jgi:hypothetical protein
VVPDPLQQFVVPICTNGTKHSITHSKILERENNDLKIHKNSNTGSNTMTKFFSSGTKLFIP